MNIKIIFEDPLVFKKGTHSIQLENIQAVFNSKTPMVSLELVFNMFLVGDDEDENPLIIDLSGMVSKNGFEIKGKLEESFDINIKSEVFKLQQAELLLALDTSSDVKFKGKLVLIIL